VILAFIISFVIPVKRARPIRGSALVHINQLSHSGVAKSQKCILVHGQMVLEKHLSVPMHYLSVLLQIQMQVFEKWLNKQNYDLTETFMFKIL